MYRSHNTVRIIKSRRLRWAGHVARMEECRSAFKILTGTTAGKRPLGRPRQDAEDYKKKMEKKYYKRKTHKKHILENIIIWSINQDNNKKRG